MTSRSPLEIAAEYRAIVIRKALSLRNGGTAWLSHFLPVETSAHSARDEPVP